MRSMLPTLAVCGLVLGGAAVTPGCTGPSRARDMSARTGERTSLPRSEPEAEGVASAGVLAFLDAVEAASLNLHSLMIVRHGRVVVEAAWSPHEAGDRHTLYSLSKSFTSTAVGLAIHEGFFGLDDHVIEFFPDEQPDEIGPNWRAMRVRDLLDMSTGHATDAFTGLGAGYEKPDADWARHILAQPVEFEPDTHFLYNNAAPYLLSMIVQRTTGKTLLDYLQPRLFEPLGIVGAVWEQSPQGFDSGHSGLWLRLEDVAKFGQLMLQRGVWEGRRVLPEAWVDEATRAQVSSGDPESDEGWPDWAQGYGYYFWRCRHNAYRGDGAFGQFCLVLPDEDAVIVITSENPEMQRTLDAVWANLLPALRGEGLDASGADSASLSRRLGRLSLPVVRAPRDWEGVADDVSGRVYAMEPNELGVETVSFTFESGRAVFTMTDGAGEHRVVCGLGEWVRGETDISPAPLFLFTTGTTLEPTSPIAACGTWWSDNIFRMRWEFVETGHHELVHCRFEGDRVWIRFARSLEAFGGAADPRPELTGRAR